MFDTSELRRNWGDQNLNDAMDAVALILGQSQFDLHSPLTLNNRGSGPAIRVIQSGDKQHIVLDSSDSEGRVLRLGYGYGSSGITASELVPDVNYALDPALITEALRTTGDGGSDPERSLLSEATSGSGVPSTVENFSPRAGWGAAFAGLQKSEDTEHAPSGAVKMTRDGQQYWWPTKPEHWHLIRATISAINTDTLTCAIVANGKVVAENVTVARNCYLQRSPWDGETIGGITYTYSDNQTRSADDGVNPAETQSIVPAYYTNGSLYDPCNHIYIAWVGNATDVSGVGWVEVLPHRVWSA